MQIFFAGAESQVAPRHAALLRRGACRRVSVSNLARHTRDYAAWATQSRLAGLDWLVYADSPTTPVAPLLELLAGSSSEPEAVVGPLDWATETWLNDSDVMFLPIWDGHDASSLRHFVELYDGIVLPDAVVRQPARRTPGASGDGSDVHARWADRPIEGHRQVRPA